MNRLLFVVIFFQQIASWAQANQPDTLFVDAALEKARNEYTLVMEGQSNIFSGTAYSFQSNLKSGHHPFFLLDDWSDGTVMYNGEFYKKVSLMYDIYDDKVIIEHYYNHSMVQLIEGKVGRFSFLNHTFIRVSGDAKSNLTEGFYELLYDGATKVLARHTKMKEKTIEGHTNLFYFVEKSRYYILKDGIYNAVKDKSSIIKVLEDQKPALKKFMSDNNINFHEERGKAIAQVAEFYDTVKK